MADTPPIPVFDLGNVFVEWDPMLLFRKPLTDLMGGVR